MYRLFETIQVKKGVLQRLSYHQQRVNRSQHEWLGIAPEISLYNIKIPAHLNRNQDYKCRITYRHQIEKVEFLPYQPRQVQSLKLVTADYLRYPFKFSDRAAFDKLLTDHQDADDILIVKNGFITDTSYSNVALLKNGNWFTPDTYLLPGTRRQFLLDTRQIKEIPVSVADIMSFERISLINAMLDLNEINIPVKSIQTDNQSL
jgi:4-amino-4-deoxychorismate lyase